MKKFACALTLAGLLCINPAMADTSVSPQKGFFKFISFNKAKVSKETKQVQKNEQKEQTQVLQFGEVKEDQVYSLNNTPESIKSSPASVDVVTLKDLEREKSSDLAKILRQHSGITLQDQGSVGDVTGIRIRGIDTVSITLDGVRIDDPSFSDPQLTHILKDGIERIEIVKGPQGTARGNRAQGGLISMFTRQGQGAPAFEYDQSFGTYATFKENFNFSGGNNSYDYFLGITRLDTNGGMKTLGNDVKRDSYGNLSVQSNLGKRLLDGKAEIRNTFRYIEAKKQVGIGYDDMTYAKGFDPNAINEHTDIIETITLSVAPTNWYDSNIKFGYYGFINENNNLRNSAFGSDALFKSKNHRFLLSTQHNLKYKDLNTLSFGYQMEKNRFSFNSADINTFDWNKFSNVDVFDGMKKSYTTNDVFVNNTFNYKDTLVLKGGARLTSSPWGTFATPNISGAIILPTPAFKDSYTKLRSTYGLAVNYPTPYQTAGSFMGAPFVSGDLSPEKLEGYDIGLVQSFVNDRLNLEFSYFDYDVKDKIQWGGVWPNSGYYNIAKATSRGLETGAKLTLMNGLTAKANYTYTNARDDQNKVLEAVPNNRWNMLLEYAPLSKRYSVYANAVTSSSRVAGGQKLNGFFDTALGGTLRLFKFKDSGNIVAWGQMSNLFNNRYELYPGYKSPGIRFLAGLSLKYDIPEREEKTVNNKLNPEKVAKTPF